MPFSDTNDWDALHEDFLVEAMMHVIPDEQEDERLDSDEEQADQEPTSKKQIQGLECYYVTCPQSQRRKHKYPSKGGAGDAGVHSRAFSICTH